MALTGGAAAVALVVVVVSAISERPIPVLRIAVVPAAAVLVVGQLWVLIVLNSRRPWSLRRWRRLGLGEARELYFSALPLRILLGIVVVFNVGWLAAATAALSLANGVTWSAGRPACQHPAYYHGSKVCLSKAAWLRAVAAEGVVGAAALSHVTVNSLAPRTGKPACPHRLDNNGSMTCVSKAAWERAVARRNARQRDSCPASLPRFSAWRGARSSAAARSEHARAPDEISGVTAARAAQPPSHMRLQLRTRVRRNDPAASPRP
jgi:hypothetical protein